MVNFHDPIVISDDFRAYHISSILTVASDITLGSSLIEALQLLCHTLGGLYMWVCCLIVTRPELTGTRLRTRWEFVITLDYELRVIQGRQPYLWTVWVRSYGTLCFRCPYA
jgi:hypothetical protein